MGDPLDADWLLLRVLTSSPQIGQAALDEWSSTVNFETGITSSNKRLLALIGAQLESLSVPGRIAGRLRGLARMRWTEEQLALHTLRQVQENLQAHIETLIPAETSPNVLGQTWERDSLEVYVRDETRSDALQVLRELGWQFTGRCVPQSRYPLTDGVRLSRGDETIFLRWKLHTVCCWSEADRGVWERAHHKVLAPEDRLLRSVVISATRPAMRSLAVLDALALDTSEIDWSLVKSEAAQRRIGLDLTRFIAMITKHLPEVALAQTSIAIDATAESCAGRGLWHRYHRFSASRSIIGFAAFAAQWIGLSDLLRTLKTCRQTTRFTP